MLVELSISCLGHAVTHDSPMTHCEDVLCLVFFNSQIHIKHLTRHVLHPLHLQVYRLCCSSRANPMVVGEPRQSPAVGRPGNWLPSELLQRIFSVSRQPWGSEPTLSVVDGVRVGTGIAWGNCCLRVTHKTRGYGCSHLLMQLQQRT